MKNIPISYRIAAGLTMVFLALILITTGCQISWGTSGALIGAGITLFIYGMIALYTNDTV